MADEKKPSWFEVAEAEEGEVIYEYYPFWVVGMAMVEQQKRIADTLEQIVEQRHLKALEEEHLMALEALEAFVEAWDKSLQLEKTDVALRKARTTLELAKERQNE